MQNTVFNHLKTNNAIDVHFCQLSKFKTNLLQIYITLPLAQNTVTTNALLPFVLYRGSKAFPTSRDLELYLNDLYGADLDVGIIKRGENQILRFSLELVNSRFLYTNENIFDKGLELLYQLIINPLFKEKYIEQEKKYVENEIKSLINNKDRYARERCFQEMCQDEPFGLFKLGRVEDLNKIAREGLISRYNSIIRNGHISILMIGEIKEGLFEKAKRLFDFEHQQPDFANYTLVNNKVHDIKEKQEILNVQQGKICMGFRAGITRKSKLYPALLIYNGILGGFPYSKLFQNVREKAGLAYYAHSQLESTKGLLLVTAGIDTLKYTKTRDIILQQVEELRKGNFSNEELIWTKEGIINQLKTAADNIRSLAGHYFLGLINDKPETIDKMIENIKKVTEEEIIEVAKNLNLDTIYFLTNKEDS